MDRLIPGLLWGLATLMVAALVHLSSILILPHVATNDAFSRLRQVSDPQSVVVLAPPGGVSPSIPFRDPSVVSAICRYDLGQGRLRVGAAVGDAAFVAVSFHTSKGVAFYALTDRSASEGRIDVLLLTPAQRDRVEAADNPDSPKHEVRVSSADQQGFVEFSVLPRVGGATAARSTLGSATCKLERDL